jgi:signal transduction histidine kinase
MINTILRNLLSNAIKFTPENGAITLESNVKSSEVEISVSDTGVGISEEDCKLLFNISTTISTKGTSNETGTGLGLIICKEFVEKQGGKIWVESEPGKGSRFIFTLPLPK